MSIMNWFRSKSALVADKKRLVATNALLDAQNTRLVAEKKKLGRALSVTLAERDSARIELTMLRGKELQRIAQCRAAARKGAQVANAKRAALKAVA